MLCRLLTVRAKIIVKRDYKHAIISLNWASIGLMLQASVQCWTISGPLWHANRDYISLTNMLFVQQISLCQNLHHLSWEYIIIYCPSFSACNLSIMVLTYSNTVCKYGIFKTHFWAALNIITWTVWGQESWISTEYNDSYQQDGLVLEIWS